MSEYQFDEWRRRCIAAIRACESHGGTVDGFATSPPATEEEVRAVERTLGLALPASLRHVIMRFAASFQIEWQLPDDISLPKALKELFSAELSWKLEALPHLESERLDWIKEVFPDPDDPYDRVWHNKLAVCEVSTGDLLALDLSTPGNEPLVYLSHDDGDGHGYVIGPDFASAIDRWTRVGCVGPEDWQWLPFVSSPTSGIDPDSSKARLWRKWFGIDRQLARL